MDQVGVLLVEDHASFRTAIGAVIALQDGLAVVGEVDRADAAAQEAVRTGPQVAVVDLDLPGGGGIEALTALRQVRPTIACLVLTASTDEVELGRAVEAGAAGVFHKSIEIEQLLDAIRRVAAGANLLDAAVSAGWLRALAAAREQGWYARVVGGSLTPREHVILTHLARGGSNQVIAEALSISPQTVQTHVRSLLSKLQVGSRLEAVTEAIRLGLVDPQVDVRTPPGLPGNG